MMMQAPPCASHHGAPQALLLCQLTVLAMGLPDTPESRAAFAALARSGAGCDGGGKDGKKSKKSKKKRKQKQESRGAESGDGAPVRPVDPLPDARRNLLESYLQPISTMLDACTIMPAQSSTGDTAKSGDGRATNLETRAFNGTLADFMTLALVEHFATRLPRTLLALFDDFERPPPDALTAALSEASPGPARVGTGESAAAHQVSQEKPSKKTKPSQEEVPGDTDSSMSTAGDHLQG